MNCPLESKKIILGISGGIAAYKAAYIASALVKRGADVHVVMTDSALKLIQPATFWAITSNQVITDIFEPPQKREIVHIALPQSADIMLIAPATANVIGKLANGIADDMLTTMALVAKKIVICPAMNVDMYQNPVVVANMDKLRGLGYEIIEAESGRLACGDEGVGRLAEPDKIVEHLEAILSGASQDYSKINVLITAGPTHESIDPVRFISNRSSGKMGYAIAAEAAARGAKVTLISGPTDLAAPSGVEVAVVQTVREMYDEVISRVASSDLFISAAAPADFRPAQPKAAKIKKSDHYTLELDQTEDILAAVGASKGNTVVVGFAAETDDLIANATEKLHRKKADLMVANYVGEGSEVFGGEANQVTLITHQSEPVELPKMSKRSVAKQILDYVKSNFLEDVK
ncbi:MAG: bifunctional phosphopantothenoylcysteine decarboxylase/phosphopantothenate--cysteine ligase CoaBC [Armatimonadetes bacterium]|jgi:phosphopantothenoylcysteine decarboxylase/phosphopantothenate--cysteine ligase|nr:bifunctional phosphopantothenoylcysteine decarboxylase/phosphopantothenate--cysteine ligase CoaBC [Armatimonadota bacterium]